MQVPLTVATLATGRTPVNCRNVKSCYKLCNWFGLILIQRSTKLFYLYLALFCYLSFYTSNSVKLCLCICMCVCVYSYLCAHQAATGIADVPKRKHNKLKWYTTTATCLSQGNNVAQPQLQPHSSRSSSHTLQFDFSRGSRSRSRSSRRTVTYLHLVPHFKFKSDMWLARPRNGTRPSCSACASASGRATASTAYKFE